MPAGGSRRFGGVKVAPTPTQAPRKFGALATPTAATPATATKARTFGGVTGEAAMAGLSVGHRSCYAKCAGEFRGPMWIHSKGCPYTVALWKAHGFTAQDWQCPYLCQPAILPNAITHNHACPFWNATDDTPIGLGAFKVPT